MNDCNYKIRHTHIVAKLNIRFWHDCSKKRLDPKKKWKTFMREKKPWKNYSSDFKWTTMSKEKKIVLSSLYSLLLHTTTTKTTQIEDEKKRTGILWMLIDCAVNAHSTTRQYDDVKVSIKSINNKNYFLFGISVFTGSTNHLLAYV